ncbi:ankyrin repeat-containing domain protein [Cladorrhinum sp. PSN259]|nr:ankyrin repeat-containing domain protein [Cladorrhinum sp. PSN259]
MDDTASTLIGSSPRPRPKRANLLPAKCDVPKDEFTVGWICAIEPEFVASQMFLDEALGRPRTQAPNDNNSYQLGVIHGHYVVMACLPARNYGTDSAAAVARDMMSSFPNIRIGLMVGVAGGAPSATHDIRLGDVVVSLAEAGQQAILQYDFGKAKQDDGFQITRLLNQPPSMLLTAVQDIKTTFKRDRIGHGLQEIIEDILDDPANEHLKGEYGRPEASTDRLYRPAVLHSNEADQYEEGCTAVCGAVESALAPRQTRKEGDEMQVHYGRVACGNSVVKDAGLRDRLSKEHNILCFEMESAGLMNHFPCLVIRGICDYSDSHKSKEWQPFASMAAAAFAWRLLDSIAPRTMALEKPMAAYLEERDQKILDWISPAEYTKRHMTKHDDTLKTWHRKTGGYLFDSSEFADWIQDTGTTLFCYGDPGAGKTVIASAVIDKIHDILEDDTRQGLAYFYAEYKDSDNQSASQILQKLLKDLATRRRRTTLQLPISVQQLYERCQRLSKSPSDEQLMGALESVVEEFEKVVIVIDALDELPPESQFGACGPICDIQRKTGKVSFLATSRRNEEVESLQAFTTSSCRKFEIKARDGDIKVYVEGRLSQVRRRWTGDRNLKDEILESIPEAAKGMFLIARLLMDQIAPRRMAGHVKDDLRSAVKHGRGGINQIYEQAMARIMSQSDDDKHYAMSALAWMTRARRPLSELELLHAIAIRPEHFPLDADYLPETGMLQSICAGLIVVSAAQGVRFVHYTTQEFFDDNQQKYFPDAEDEITITCAELLGVSSHDPADCRKDWNWNPLHHYAVDHWMYHAKNALQQQRDPGNRVERSLCRYLTDGTRVQASSKVECRGTTGLHLATMYNLTPIIKPLMRLTWEKDPRDGFGRSPLSRAAKLGLKEIAKELLSFEEVDPDSVCNWGGSPLCHAIHNHTSDTLEIVQMLLSTGRVDVDRLYEGQTPLYLAITHQNEELVSLLLDNKANPNVVVTPGGGWMHKFNQWETSSLILATKQRNLGIMKMLLKAKADPNLGVNMKVSDASLMMSVLKGEFWEGARLLIDHGARTIHDDSSRLELSRFDLDAVLNKAIKNKDMIVLEILVEGGAVAAGRELGYPYTCPLWMAWHEGWLEAMEKLALSPFGPSQEPPRATLQWLDERNGRTEEERVQHDLFVGAVADIILQAHPEYVKDLGLGSGLDHHLVTACLEGKNYYVMALLKHGAVPERSAELLALASYNGHKGLVELLLEHGSNINTRDIQNSATPLQYAVERGHVELCKFLLDRKADTEIRCKDGRSPLMMASWIGNTSVCRLLLDHGAQIEATSSTGTTALLFATAGGHVETCRALLDRGADVETRGRFGRTPLIMAAEFDKIEVCRLLLDRNAQIEARSSEGDTALSMAAHKNHLDICRLLLSQKADIETRDSYEQTPLLVASFYGSNLLCELLLDFCANREVVDIGGSTPLSLALDRGDAITIRLLMTYRPGIHINICKWPLGYDSNSLLLGLLGQTWDTNCKLRVAEFFYNYAKDEKNINISTPSGQTPLHLAVLSDHRPLVRHLIRQGADTKIQDIRGDTPLLLAVRMALETLCEDFVEELIARTLAQVSIHIWTSASGATLMDSRDSNGDTALLLATKRGNWAICEALLKLHWHSETETRDANGKSAFDWAPKVWNIFLLRRLLPPNENTIHHPKESDMGVEHPALKKMKAWHAVQETEGSPNKRCITENSSDSTSLGLEDEEQGM